MSMRQTSEKILVLACEGEQLRRGTLFPVNGANKADALPFTHVIIWPDTLRQPLQILLCSHSSKTAACALASRWSRCSRFSAPVCPAMWRFHWHQWFPCASVESGTAQLLLLSGTAGSPRVFPPFLYVPLRLFYISF